MFKKNKPTKTVKKVNSFPTVNIVSEGTQVVGNMRTQSDIRVSGLVQGEVHSSGKLIITLAGKINGNIQSNNADISGKIDGEVFVKHKLILRKSAVIDGNINTKNLIVEEGATINGACRMGDISHKLTQLSEKNYKKEPHLKASGS